MVEFVLMKWQLFQLNVTFETNISVIIVLTKFLPKRL